MSFELCNASSWVLKEQHGEPLAFNILQGWWVEVQWGNGNQQERCKRKYRFLLFKICRPVPALLLEQLPSRLWNITANVYDSCRTLPNFCFVFSLHWRDKKCVICFSVAVSLWSIFPECVSSGSAHAHDVHVDVFRLHTTVKSGVEVLIFQDRRLLQGFVWNGELGSFKLGPNLEPVWVWN